MTVDKPMYSFANPAAEYKVDEDFVLRDAEEGEDAKPRSESQRSRDRTQGASISDHDLVVGSMKGLKGMPEDSPVVTEDVLTEEPEPTSPGADADDDDGVEGTKGIHRGGPRGATVAVVHMEPNEFEDAIRMARKPSPSMKVRPTYTETEVDDPFP